ncbi:hypothetical protein HNQ81_002671, partial [Desulfoprunum benzoelyticum]|nr:hypothetical protein [Desulfoprunum benzoelyticum]
ATPLRNHTRFIQHVPSPKDRGKLLYLLDHVKIDFH